MRGSRVDDGMGTPPTRDGADESIDAICDNVDDDGDGDGDGVGGFHVQFSGGRRPPSPVPMCTFECDNVIDIERTSA